MNRSLLAMAMAVGICSYSYAATPVEVGASITTGSKVEIVDNFNIKFTDSQGSSLVSMMEKVSVDASKKITIISGSSSFESTSATCNFSSVVTVSYDPAVRQAGTYTIEIPEGFITWNGQTNKAITLTDALTVSGSSVTITQAQFMGADTSAPIQIDPADGSQQSSLGIFTLVNSSKFEIARMNNAVLRTPSGEELVSQATILEDDTQVRFQFLNQTEPGNYTLTIPEGTLRTTLNHEPKGSTLNPELVFAYSIKGSGPVETLNPVDVALAVSPLNATTTADSFTSFNVLLSVSGEALPAFTIDPEKISSVVVKSDASSYIPASVVASTAAASTIELRFATPVISGGTYSIELPEGLVCWEKNTNRAVTLDNAFTCTGTVVDLFSDINWYRGSSWSTRLPIENFELDAIGRIMGEFTSFPADVQLEIPVDGEDPDFAMSTAVALVQYPGGEILERTINKVSQTNNAFAINVSDSGTLNTPGKYTITIPAGSFTADGQPNPKINAVFNIEDKNVYTPVELYMIPTPRADLPLEELTYVSWEFSIEDSEGERLYTARPLKAGAKATVTRLEDGRVYEYPIVDYTYNQTGMIGYGFDLIPDISAAGTYKVVFPADVIRLSRRDGELCTNMEQTVTYTVVGVSTPSVNVSVPVTPSMGDVVSLSKFEFSKPTGFSLFLPENPIEFEVTCPDGSVVKATPTTNANVAGEYVFLSLPEKLTAPGDYKLTVPQGGFELYDASDNMYANKEIVYSYTIEEYEAADLNYVANPASGSSIYYLPYVYVSFTEPVEFVYGSTAQLTNPSGAKSDVRISFNKSNNRLMFDFGYESALGEYTFVIPEGTVKTADDRINKEIVLTYRYVNREVANVNFIISPEQGNVGELDVVTLTCPSDYTKCVANESGLAKVQYFKDNEAPTNAYIESTANPLVFSIELKEPIRESCFVTMEIPEDTFTLTKTDGNEVVNAGKRLTWKVDPAGVEAIPSDNGLYTVYTTSGVCLMRDAEPAQLSTLTPGIYVINGKKISIR